MKQIQGSILSGYITVLVKGKSPELFFQQCIDNGMVIWNIKKKSAEECIGNIKLEDMEQIEEMIELSNYTLVTVRKKGLPFLLKRLLKRKELYFSVVASLLFIVFLSNVIWKVEISGIPKDLEEKISEQLTNYGIHAGAWAFTLDSPGTIQQKLVQDIPELLWVGVHKQGTTIFLEAVEKKAIEEEEIPGPRHIIATKKGIISKVYVAKGVPQVRIHDYVEPGDVLVSGILNEQDEKQTDEEQDQEQETDQILVASDGEVLANTWYEMSVSVPIQSHHERLTGEQFKKYYVGLGPFNVLVWGFKTPEYQDVYIEQNEKPLFFLKWKLPLKIIESTINEKTYQKRKRTKEEAVRVGIEQAKQELQLQLGPEAKIISEEVLHETIERGKVKLTLYITVEENIGKTQSIMSDSKED